MNFPRFSFLLSLAVSLPLVAEARVDGYMIPESGGGSDTVVYVAVDGEEGEVDVGGKKVGNGSYLLDATGEFAADCGKQPDLCRELLENALGGSETSTKTASPAATATRYGKKIKLSRTKDGRLKFEPGRF